MKFAKPFSQRAQFAGAQPISELMAMALARPELISLAAGFVDQDSLPVAETGEAIRRYYLIRVLGRSALQYGTNAGYMPLRRAVLERFLAADGHATAAPPTVEQVILTAGSNQLLHLVNEVLLDPGDIVLCAAPSYFVYLGILRGLGARSVGVASDRDGMIPEALEEELDRRQRSGELEAVKAIYLTSYYENPSAATLSLERRQRIVEIAKRRAAAAPIYVIDDAAYRELRYAGPALPSLRSFDDAGDTVIVAETFSKSFSPGIRVGWGILPPALVGPVSAIKGNVDFGSPNFNQYLMATVLERGLFEPHVEQLRAAYRPKLAAMLAALDEHLGAVEGIRWDVPAGGLYVWLRLPDGMDAGPGGSLMGHALDEGVLYVPGEYCYPGEGEASRVDRIRLSFGVQTAENIRRGIAALREQSAGRDSRSRTAGPGSDQRTKERKPVASVAEAQYGGGILRLLIIDRYLLRQFLQTFFICFCSLTGLYIVIDGFGNLEEFIAVTQLQNRGNLLSVMGEYYAYRSLSFFDSTSHVLTLIAAMFTVTWIQRHNELTALQAAGIPKVRIMRPVIVVVVAISLASALNRELVIPRVREKLSNTAQDMAGTTGKSLRPRYDNETDVLLGGSASQMFADELRIHNPDFFMPNGLDRYGPRIAAEDAFYQPAHDGRPSGYLFRKLEQPKGLEQVPSLALGDRPVLLTPRDTPWLKPGECFLVSNVSFEHLEAGGSWRQLSSTAELIQGLRNRSLDFGADERLLIHARLVKPLLDVLLLFLGLPLVLSRTNRNVFLAIGMCLGLVVAFMLVGLACQYLGSSYWLEPALAAWLPLMIFVPCAVGLSQPLRDERRRAVRHISRDPALAGSAQGSVMSKPSPVDENARPWVEGLTMPQVLRETARRHPANHALAFPALGLHVSYREFSEQVDHAARGLLALGIRQGEHVAIWATNVPEWVVLQFATARIGAVLVNINPAYRPFELKYVLNQSDSVALFLVEKFKTSDYFAMLNEVCPELAASRPGELRSADFPKLRHVVALETKAPAGAIPWAEMLKRGERIPAHQLDEIDRQLQPTQPINIQYTSGTTGFPKAAMLSHRNLLLNGYYSGMCQSFTANDRICIPVPFYHCFGCVLGTITAVVYGAAMVIPAESFNPRATLDAIEKERATALYGVPTMFIAQLQDPSFDGRDLTSLRTGIMSGSPCPIEVMRQVVDRMGASQITIGYGQTEASPLITQCRNTDPIELRVETVGRVLPGVEVKIVDPATGQTLGDKQQGELCARGHVVMLGYYHNEEATQTAIDPEGWLHTGDLAIRLPNGYFRITGRIKDMVIRGGENIYPREIEEFLFTHSHVEQAAVVGVPDKKYVEELCAWVKLKSGCTCTEDEIRDFCREKLAHYKVPRYVKFVDSFPQTVTGKIQKFKIRELMIVEYGLEEQETA